MAASPRSIESRVKLRQKLFSLKRFLPMASEPEQQTVDPCTGEVDKQRESVMSNEEQSSEQLSNSRDSQGEHDERRLTGHHDFHPPTLKDIEVEDNSSPRSIGSMGRGSLNRDLVLAKLNQDKTISLIKAWEEHMKAKSLHRYNRKVAKITAWEKSMKSKAESNLRALEERLEKEKAMSVERMRNEIAAVQMRAEEDRALAEARHGEELLKAEEFAAKYRASGSLPKRHPFCFTCN